MTSRLVENLEVAIRTMRKYNYKQETILDYLEDFKRLHPKHSKYVEYLKSKELSS